MAEVSWIGAALIWGATTYFVGLKHGRRTECHDRDYVAIEP